MPYINFQYNTGVEDLTNVSQLSDRVNIYRQQQNNTIEMIELKSDHVHSKQQPLQQINESNEFEIPTPPPKKKVRKVRIKTLPTNDPNEHFYADALIPQLELAMSEIEGPIFQAISLARKQIQFKVYNGVVEDQDEFLHRLFNSQSKSQYWVREAIKQTVEDVKSSIVKEIMGGDYYVHRTAKLTKEDIFNGSKNTEAAIKIREQMLKAKLSQFKADLSGRSQQSSIDIFSPNSSDLYSSKNQRTKRASQFVKRMQKEQEQIRQHYKRKQQNTKYKKRMAQEQEREIELRLKQERHDFLKHQYEEKRKEKEREREENMKKSEQFKEYMKEHKKKKPLFKKREEEFFEKFVVPDNEKKLSILKEIREQHQPLSHEELKEHERQYLEIRDDHFYEKNAERAMQSKARKADKVYYRSKFHSFIEKQQQERQNFQDPLEKKTKLYQKRWQYATEIKTKFKPKISPKKRAELKSLEEQSKSSLKYVNRRSSDAYKSDGKNNLETLHRYIAELRAKGRIRYGSASNTIEQSSKPKYKNYLKEIQRSHETMRRSIDYSDLVEKDEQKLKFEMKKLESDATRREQYLTHLGSYNMDSFMDQKKKLDNDYLESARAKLAILNKYG